MVAIDLKVMCSVVLLFDGRLVGVTKGRAINQLRSHTRQGDVECWSDALDSDGSIKN